MLKIKEDDEKKVKRNEDWIKKNKLYAEKWIIENKHRFGNSREFTKKPDLFYILSDEVLFLSIRFPSSCKKGNIAIALSYNKEPSDFIEARKETIKNLLNLKHT